MDSTASKPKHRTTRRRTAKSCAARMKRISKLRCNQTSTSTPSSNSTSPQPPTPSPQPPTPSRQPPTPSPQCSSSKRKLEYYKDFPILETTEGVDYAFIDISILKSLFTPLKCPTCDGISLQLQTTTKPHMGMGVQLYVICSVCEASVVECYSSRKLASQTLDVNRRATLATLSVGLGHAGLASFCEVMGVRPLGKTSFQTHKKAIHDASVRAKMSLLESTHSIVRDAYISSSLATPDDDGILDITVSYDGSWHKRGHTSRHGLGCIIDTVTGLVVDYDTMAQYCQSCVTTGKSKKAESQQAYDEWWLSHEPTCEANHVGSSGMMEVAVAKILWQRSLEYNFRYTTMVGDGDSKTHNELTSLSPYGEDHPVLKEECISHFSKRLGTALWKVVSTAKSQGVTLGGVRHGSLTQNKMVLMQRYFTKAILSHPGNLPGMRDAIWAIYLHAASTDQSPQDQFCSPVWCHQRKAAIENLPQPQHSSSIVINEKVAGYIKPTFERLTGDEILQRCLQGRTQNPNESVHSVIWTFVPKGRFVGATRIKLGVFLGAGQFNSGSRSLFLLMNECQLTIPSICSKIGLWKDARRIQSAEKSTLVEFKRRKHIRQQANIRLQGALEEAEGGPVYSSGAF